MTGISADISIQSKTFLEQWKQARDRTVCDITTGLPMAHGRTDTNFGWIPWRQVKCTSKRTFQRSSQRFKNQDGYHDNKWKHKHKD